MCVTSKCIKPCWKKFSNNIPSSNTNTVTVNSSGKYRVQVTDQKGCTRLSDAVDVTAACKLSDNGNSNNATVYPNPSKDGFNIALQGEESEDLQIEIYNMIGVAIPFERSVSEDGSVRIEGLVPGIYFAKIKGSETNKAIRIVRE